MYSYTVTIGRNYSTGKSVSPSMRGKAMTLTQWGTFVEDVNAELANFLFLTDDALETHYGKGVWDGVEEESAKVTLLKSSPLEEPALDNLRHALSELARLYDQDAIALTIGQSELC